MYLVAMAWMYVVALMAAVEATSSTGSLLGALVTLVLYGLLPLAIVMYLLNTPARRRTRRAAAARGAASAPMAAADPSARRLDPDHGGHAAGDAIAPERKEP